MKNIRAKLNSCLLKSNQLFLNFVIKVFNELLHFNLSLKSSFVTFWLFWLSKFVFLLISHTHTHIPLSA